MMQTLTNALTSNPLGGAARSAMEPSLFSKENKLPKFENKSGEDPLAFVNEAERCLKARSLTDAQMLEKIPLMLSQELLYWWERVKGSVATWSVFRETFCKSFLGNDYKRQLTIKILNRKQKSKEPVLAYVLDLERMCKQLDPNMKEDDIVEKVLAGLDPWLILNMRLPDKATLSDVQEKAQEAQALRDRCEKFDKESKTEGFRDTTGPQNFNNSGRNFYRGANKFANQDQKGPNSGALPKRNDTSTSQRGGSNSNYHGNKNYSQSNYYGQSNNYDRRPVRCFKCGRIGHKEFQCRSRESSDRDNKSSSARASLVSGQNNADNESEETICKTSTHSQDSRQDHLSASTVCFKRPFFEDLLIKMEGVGRKEPAGAQRENPNFSENNIEKKKNEWEELKSIELEPMDNKKAKKVKVDACSISYVQ